MGFNQEKHSFRKGLKAPWIKHLQICFILAIFFFLVWGFYQGIQKTRDIKWSFEYPFLFLSIFFLVLALISQAWIWKVNLNIIGTNKSFKHIFKLFYLANMAGYLPGKIWSVLGVVHLAKKADIPQTSAVLCTMVTLITCFLAGLLFSAATLIGLSAYGHGTSLGWIGVSLVFSLIILHPYVYNRILSLVAKFTGEKNVKAEFPLDGIVKSTLFYVVVWFFHGLSFSFLVLSLGDFTFRWFLYCLGVMPLAYLAGYVVLLSPGGWGVREGAMVLLLKEFMPNYLAIAVSILSRLLSTILEVVFFLIALRIKWDERKGQEISNSS
jgi:glycosyltransferase 2 family protein